MMDWNKLIRDDQPISYPLYQRSENRIQVIYGLERYAFTLSYPLDFLWVGYVRVNQATARILDSHIKAPETITYIAPAGRFVTWMGPTVDGRLRNPMQLFDPAVEPDGDFWVGFDNPITESWGEGDRLAQLSFFESTIREFEKAYCNDDTRISG